MAVAVCVAVVCVWLASSGPSRGGSSPSAAAVRVTLPAVHTPVAATTTSHLRALPLPWPRSGQAAVAIPGLGFAERSRAEVRAPVASLTKIMTAYVVLEDHPLVLGQTGPRITVTPRDAGQFGEDTVTDQSNVELRSGEKLSERQLLEGLIVHSANDFAYTLATWDAGSVAAFVGKMNAQARALGMSQTHFADASGYSPRSESTASDLLKVAAVAMADPAFARIAAMKTVTLPFAGTVDTYTPMLTAPGVVGVKTGFTDAAGGGVVMAYEPSAVTTVAAQSLNAPEQSLNAVAQPTKEPAQPASDASELSFQEPLMVLAAVTAQEGPNVLARAAAQAIALAKAAASKMTTVTVAPAGTEVARLVDGGRGVPVTTARSARLMVLPGDAVHQVVHVVAPRQGAPAGTVVGSVRFELGGEDVSVPVRTTRKLG